MIKTTIIDMDNENLQDKVPFRMIDLVRCMTWSKERLEKELLQPIREKVGNSTIIHNSWKNLVYNLLLDGHQVEFINNQFIFRVPIKKTEAWVCNTNFELAFWEEESKDYFIDIIVQMLWPRSIVVM